MRQNAARFPPDRRTGRNEARALPPLPDESAWPTYPQCVQRRNSEDTNRMENAKAQRMEGLPDSETPPSSALYATRERIIYNEEKTKFASAVDF